MRRKAGIGFKLLSAAVIGFALSGNVQPISAAEQSKSAAAAVPEENLSPVVYVFDLRAKDESILVQNGVTYLSVKQLTEMLNDFVWDMNEKTGVVTVSGPNHTLSWSKGSRHAVVNRKNRTMQGTLLYNNGTFYLPLRETMKWAGGTVKDDSKTEVIVTYTVRSIRGGDADRWYWVRRDNGIVYTAAGSEMPHNIGQSWVRASQYYSMQITPMTDDSTVLTIDHNYGEPSRYDDLYKLIIYKGRLVRQSLERYNGDHPHVNISEADGHIVMLNGTELQFIGTDGSLKQRYDLKKLSGLDESSFTVEYASPADGLAIIRPYNFQTSLLIDLRGGTSVTLYKELLSEEEQKALDERIPYMYDYDYRGDSLKFVKRDGNDFIFEHESLLDNAGTGTLQLTYTMER